MATITFTPSGETIEVPHGTSLLDAAILCELDVPAPCAGQGRCGRCSVRVMSGEVERRSNAALATAEILEGWAVACQTYAGEGAIEVDVPERSKEKVRPHGHAIAEPESLPITCDYQQDPAVRLFELDIEPPSLDDQTADFDRLRRALQQQHGIEELRAELPAARAHGHGAAPRQLEGHRGARDARLGVRMLPPAAPAARVPDGLPAGQHGPRGRPRHDRRRRLPGRLHRPAASSTRPAPTTSRSPAATTSSAASSTPSASTGLSGCRSSPSRPSTTCSTSCSSATTSSRARSTKWPSPATRR